MTALAQERSAAIRHVDALAETAAQQWASPGATRNAIYLLKREEARACLIDPAPVAEAYPLLAAEVGITAETLAGVAAVVIAMAEQWIAIAAVIEAERLGAHKAIREAMTSAAIWQAARVSFPKPPDL